METGRWGEDNITRIAWTKGKGIDKISINFKTKNTCINIKWMNLERICLVENQTAAHITCYKHDTISTWFAETLSWYSHEICVTANEQQANKKASRYLKDKCKS